ncbi:hypothetical protein PHMEG_00011613 [Phytophthora megakarya]|uniref:Retrotransposon gag domain-containing protein n=1 Tax=Phytophthora megakarya TaxID=4795 RepID=A0A225WAT9_9STRA|nr:hypothetical protein PHMEG_00011613 [Phytophthora megakarya]
MVSNLQGQAAAWYVTQQTSINTIDELADALRREFIPADLHERLRDALYKRKQHEGCDLADYVTRYRKLIMRVKEMSNIDKIIIFARGLVTQTSSEVICRRYSRVYDAISIAMEYERAHPSYHNTKAKVAAEPMEIDQGRFVSRGECFQRNLCFSCENPGHRMSNSRQRSQNERPAMERVADAARQRVGNM